MTKQEKRLFIREVAKEIYARCANDFPAGQEQKVSARVISDASALADELEAFERKQDEEEDKMRYCFGIGIKEESPSSEKECVASQWDCSTCLVEKQCQSKRGAK